MQENKKDIISNRIETFEERFSQMSEKLVEDREAMRRKRADKDPSVLVQADAPSGAIAIYKSRAAAAQYQHKKRSEGAIHRTIRLVRGLKEAKKRADAMPGCSAENRRAMYDEVYRDAWAPVANAVDNAADTLWGFLSALGYDALEILVFIVNMVIKLWYYLGSVLLFIWDKIWDFRLWLDIHKKGAFQIFAGVTSVVALVLILISSMSGYQYSYYGRLLGTVKSKQDVYRVIEKLGDKLAESSGANISLDVERDIVFERVYGFGLDIDSQDDILNTLTYMKDIRVQAYAVCIDGKPTVVVDNENTANSIIERVKDYFSQPKPGYEYLSVSVGEEVTVEEVTAKLAELWNPLSAVRYIETGTVRVLKEGEEANPLVTVYASATVSDFSEIPYGTRYVKSNALYKTEVIPVSEGVPGTMRTDSLVQIVNGIEVSKVEQSSVVVTNPVDAVFEQGTKEPPASIGTGTWLFPLKGSYTITSHFGSRARPVAGATTYHEGVDLYQAIGSRIYAADGGVVVFSGYQGGLGYNVKIDHGGLYQTVYAHCSKLLVSVGDTVVQGQVIAQLGRSGNVSGPHLHFEVHFNGKAFDPLTLTFINNQ